MHRCHNRPNAYAKTRRIDARSCAFLPSERSEGVSSTALADLSTPMIS